MLDETFETVYIIDMYESFIWTDRYASYGDFEIYMPMDEIVFDITRQDYFLYIRESDRLMIIEEKQVISDVETGVYMSITGRSCESLLDRRIVWKQTVLNGNFQNQVEKLLNENMINPKDEDREMPKFIFVPSEDERITSLKIKTQFTGESLYDAIVEMCDSLGIGFRVRYMEKVGLLAFELFVGTDYSYSQKKRPYIVFSKNFDNLLNSNYNTSTTTYKNIALVAGEGEGTKRKTRVVGAGKGLDRREVFIDARDLSSDGETIKEYNEHLDERGYEKLLTDYKFVEVFEGEVDYQRTYIYGKDYVVGDIVQVINEYGIEARARITEIIRSWDTSGYSLVPTFEQIDTNLED